MCVNAENDAILFLGVRYIMCSLCCLVGFFLVFSFCLLYVFIYFSCIFLYGTLCLRFGTIPTSHHQCHYYGTVIISVNIAAMSPPVITSVTTAALPSSVSLLLHCHHQCHYCCTVITSVTIAALSSSASLLLHCHHQSSVSLTLQRHRQNDCSDKAEDT